MDVLLNIEVDNLRLRCIGRPDHTDDIIYFNTDFDTISDVGIELEKMLNTRPFPILCAIEGEDWGRDLSPWPAKKVFRESEDFTGGGPAYLQKLTQEVLPAVEKELFGEKVRDHKASDTPHGAGSDQAGPRPVHRGLIGYSLGGLFAFWALFESDVFDCAASVSGSLWYDGFTDFAESTEFKKRPLGVYLSVGDREHKTRNKRMALVENCMDECEALCVRRGIPVKKERNRGNHFEEVPHRIAKAAAALTEFMRE